MEQNQGVPSPGRWGQFGSCRIVGDDLNSVSSEGTDIPVTPGGAESQVGGAVGGDTLPLGQ
jgi:hypothetical protein